MRKMTLLEMVQNILSALDSDEVNSIADTVESLQVAEIIKETFYEQFNNIFLPEFQGLVQLQSVNDVARPNYLRIPDNVTKIEWIKYKNKEGHFTTVEYISPEAFLETHLQIQDGFATDDPSGNVTYFIRDNKHPTYFTIFDDKYIAFDSFDTGLETTMTAAHSLCYATKSQDFELEDDYVPPIDGNLFPLLLAESKSTAFINLKQISSTKEEQRARRQRIRMQNDQFRSRRQQYDYWDRGADFSRRR